MSTLQTEASEEKKRPPRFLLAMPDDLRAAVERAAFVNGRTLTAEINLRLKATLDAEAAGPKAEPARDYQTLTMAGGEGLPQRTLVMRTANDARTSSEASSDPAPHTALTKTDQAMLDVFRAMPPEKQLALLSLFR